MSGPLTTWFAGLVMGALFGLAAGLCWVLPKLICALNRLAELEAEVERLKAGDPQTHMQIGDVLAGGRRP